MCVGAHLSACILERFQFLQPSLVIFQPSFFWARNNAYSNSRQISLRLCERELRYTGRRMSAPFVSHFVIAVLSKVAISRSKCHRACLKSDRIVKNLDHYEIEPIIRALSRGDCRHFDGDNSFRLHMPYTQLQYSHLITLEILCIKIKSDVLLFRLSIFDSAGSSFRAIFGIAINDQRWILIAPWGF